MPKPEISINYTIHILIKTSTIFSFLPGIPGIPGTSMISFVKGKTEVSLDLPD